MYVDLHVTAVLPSYCYRKNLQFKLLKQDISQLQSNETLLKLAVAHEVLLMQFVIETKPTGREKEMTEGRTTEHLGTEEKIVQVTKPNPCGGVPTS